MNKRIRKGLFWPTHRAPTPFRTIAIVTACALTYGLVAKFDGLEKRAKHMEKLARSNEGLAAVTLSCMNGASGFYWKDAGIAFECGKEL